MAVLFVDCGPEIHGARMAAMICIIWALFASLLASVDEFVANADPAIIRNEIKKTERILKNIAIQRSS